jgi:hypothetical protein
VPVSGEVATSVSLVSCSASPFQVLGVTSSEPDVTIEQIGDSQSYRVRLAAPRVGQITRHIVFEVAAADGRYPISVTVSYLGVREGESR